MRVTFIGLGAMGRPMAMRLAQSGAGVAGRDLDSAREASWHARADAASHGIEAAEVVIACVTDDAASASVAEAVLPAISRGALYIDHTTTSPALARRLAGACVERGVAFVDAPLSGGVEGATAGTLVALTGGTAEDIARAAPVLAAYASRTVHLGPAGSGQLGKLANQLAIAGTVRGLAEGVTLARHARLDVAALLDALGRGTARSAQLERIRERLTADDFDFAAAFGWLAKDLDLVLQEGESRGLALPLARLVHQTLED